MRGFKNNKFQDEVVHFFCLIIDKTRAPRLVIVLVFSDRIKWYIYNRGGFVRYKVEGNMHLWGWTDFKEEINGKIIDYKTDKNVICWMEFESNEDFKYIDSVLDYYGLMVVET